MNENEVNRLLPSVNKDEREQDVAIRLYPRRWLVLFVFSLNSLANACLFACISAINDIASRYWHVKPSVIDWLPNSFVLLYVFIALPSAYLMSTYGLRVTVIAASSLNGIAAALHFAGYQSDGFIFVAIGQIFAAFSVGVILQAPSQLSTTWFGEHEHAKATSIAMLANIFGVAIGFIQPTHMVPDSANVEEVHNGMFWLFTSQLIFLGICLVLVYLFFEDKPPTPPSYAAAFTDDSANENKLSFLKSIKMLASQKDYNLLVHAYGLYFGMFVFFSIVLNEMVNSIATDDEIGWMGFSNECAGILGIFISAQIIDRFQCYRLLSSGLLFCVLVSWIGFTFALIHKLHPNVIFPLFGLVGFFGVPFFSVGIEQASEMTYPISESLSSAVVLLMANLYGFIFVLLFGAWIDKGHLPLVCYATTGIYAVAFLFAAATKTKMNRQEAERTHIVQTDFDDDSDEDGIDDKSLYTIAAGHNLGSEYAVA